MPASPTGNAFRIYAELSGNFNLGAIGSMQTGVAIANPSSTAITVNFELNSLTGASTGLTGIVTIPGNGQVAMFLGQIQGLSALASPFQGVLRVSTASSSGMSMVGLRGRYNERGDFLVTTIPVTNEASPAATSELIFPQIVDQGGYSTQFILFSGVAGQSTTGTLRFFGQDGQPLTLTVR